MYKAVQGFKNRTLNKLAMLRQSYCYQKYKSLERNLVALFFIK